MHFHWRWGAGAQILGQSPVLNKYGGVYQPFQAAELRTAEGIKKRQELSKKLRDIGEIVKSLDYSDLGGLTDPHIPIQTHRFAIIKNRPALDPSARNKNNDFIVTDLHELCEDEFYDLFIRNGEDPQEINNPNWAHKPEFEGADTVLWYSVEAFTHHHPKVHAAGTLLTNGMYFAHDPEPDSILRGVTEPVYHPWTADELKNNTHWFRSPDLYPNGND